MRTMLMLMAAMAGCTDPKNPHVMSYDDCLQLWSPGGRGEMLCETGCAAGPASPPVIKEGECGGRSPAFVVEYDGQRGACLPEQKRLFNDDRLTLVMVWHDC